jgi:hypothetical protein
MLALAQDRRHLLGRDHIVAALQKPANLQIVRMIGGDDARATVVFATTPSAIISASAADGGLIPPNSAPIKLQAT